MASVNAVNVEHVSDKFLKYTESDTVHELRLENIVGARKLEENVWNVIFVEETKGQDEKDAKSTPKLQSLLAKDLNSSFLDVYDIQLAKDNLPPRNDDNSPNTHVVISTLSGTGLAPSFYHDTLHPFLDLLDINENEDYTVHFTQSASTVSELTQNTFLQRANSGIAQRITLLSGDGGIVDILNAMMSTPHSRDYVEPIISLLPMGTGNALAHSSGITADNTTGLSTLARGQPKHLPLFKAIFSLGARLLADEGCKHEGLPLYDDGEEGSKPILYGAVVCSWGLHAGLVADSDTAEYRKYGIQRFAMAAKEALYPSDGSTPHKYKARVVLFRKDPNNNSGGTSFEEIPRAEHSYILATLVSNLEKTFTISPLSAPLEGNLRVVHFGHVDGKEAMRILGLAYDNGKHVEDAAVGYEDVDSMIVEFQEEDEDGRWRRVCVDGKIVVVEKGGSVEVKRETGRVLKISCLVQMVIGGKDCGIEEQL
ncbi:hypothetical protein EJ08DRAFT_736908 [Tothia fuscella]|uniref:DAGKc domain-containing protein n=1 Tax=Tothia fuscella TaxID=1048955 RepID=A0A9P4NKP1_9PEZI|nr:hypothetical protein EJ08DRAFT_736908 [Tothia fuscella]